MDIDAVIRDLRTKALEILDRDLPLHPEAEPEIRAITSGIYLMVRTEGASDPEKVNCIKCFVGRAYSLGFEAGQGKVQGAREIEELFGSIVEDAFANGD